MTKLDLGCGPNKKPGFSGCDATAFAGVDVVHDLRQPWPWPDNSIEEVHSSHFLEHLTAMERVHFFNELYRVLVPGVIGPDGKPSKGFATIITPHWASCRAYGDPTHQWPPVSEFLWFYLSRDWRKGNAPHTDMHPRGLDPHGNGGKTGEINPVGFDCNFQVGWGYSFEPGVAARNQEYVQFAQTYYKEACQDMWATVTKA